MRLRPYLMLAVGMMLLSGTVLAQDDFPRVELFGGFNYMRTSGHSNVNGFNTQAAVNLTRWLGFAADLSGSFQTSADADVSQRTQARPAANAYSFLFGPQVSDRAGKAKGFAHFLIGAAKLEQGFNTGRGGVPVDDSVLSMAFGGGIDVTVNSMVDVRVISADYQYIKSPDVPLVPVGFMSGGRNNMRIAFGIVFKIK